MATLQPHSREPWHRSPNAQDVRKALSGEAEAREADERPAVEVIRALKVREARLGYRPPSQQH